MPTLPSLQGMRRCGLVLVVVATIALAPRLESQEPAAPVLESTPRSCVASLATVTPAPCQRDHRQ
jgi:hypothetical protein